MDTNTVTLSLNGSNHNHTAVNQFHEDVLRGLTSTPKRLDSKYFYDAIGDQLFQDLMNCAEYYPTNCELDIFKNQTAALAKSIIGNDQDDFDLIELGAGDAMKSSYLLKYLLDEGIKFTYLPIDISAHVIEELDTNLAKTLPGLNFRGLNGEYFEMLQKAATLSNKRKVVLFLGSNIGNMPVAEAEAFCHELRNSLSPGDMALIGFDLKKNPKTILAAYNDGDGITKKFNLNLLSRINKELGADFKVEQFDHYPTYDPETGACKSYLISLADQKVHLADYNESIHFQKDEYIYMEISQKFTTEQIKSMAANTGFQTVKYLFDAKNWFTDAIWRVQ
ncbi:dimethylhistidine N-methyltransferase [Mucilaginibacter gracilis]|uniref:Dimethylhistidine N-methyltransferase n=1 Tax=Mucilaginibacter gracilis TaxID=423350 RepID=A0A495IVX2_9SPHI|nr:L-histidine N(alpha)-methyltransferase [Mucilaginibacter gracilis]RKR80164.1 dimethylhistidine N-methyltransferase [Mucilaginibacter gracilis]